MSQLILNRRHFLTLAAPAIVTAANLMPGHSMAKLLAALPPLEAGHHRAEISDHL